VGQEAIGEPMLGIVIPIHNESAALDPLFERLQRVLDSLDLPAVVCLVDDGSSDDSLPKMRELSCRDPRFRYLSLSRNFGHQTAIVAGLRELDADVYVIMDGDLQDPPELIPELLSRWREDYQVVYCQRQGRAENVVLRAAYALFYRVLRSMSYLEIPLDTGDFCLMDRRVVDHLRRMKEHNPFVRGLRTWVGYRQTAVTYRRAVRSVGTSKYTFRKLLTLAYDGIISFSFAPLKVIVNFGLATSFLSFLAICFLLIQKVFFGIPLLGWTSLAVLILFMGGIQLLTIGVMGEYLGRIFDEVKNRPLYIVRESNLGQAEPIAVEQTSELPALAAAPAIGEARAVDP
jgi:dolichol-phosphate mannosyltransferase